MTTATLPDCPWCDAADTLDAEWVEMGARYCRCTRCSKRVRVDYDNRAYRMDDVYEHDVSGALIDGP